MSDQTELEAARLARAALELIRNALPFGDVREYVTSCLVDMDAMVRHGEFDAPPWISDQPERDLSWSDVICGDSVKAPNGAWYEVESWCRTGTQVAVMLLVNGARVKSVRKAADKVPVRRGPAGQAADVFKNAGFDLEVLAA